MSMHYNSFEGRLAISQIQPSFLLSACESTLQYGICVLLTYISIIDFSQARARTRTLQHNRLSAHIHVGAGRALLAEREHGALGAP